MKKHKPAVRDRISVARNNGTPARQFPPSGTAGFSRPTPQNKVLNGHAPLKKNKVKQSETHQNKVKQSRGTPATLLHACKFHHLSASHISLAEIN